MVRRVRERDQRCLTFHRTGPPEKTGYHRLRRREETEVHGTFTKKETVSVRTTVTEE